MAAAETARLIASLELQDRNFTRGIRQVERGVDRVDRKLGAFSGFINRNMARAIDSIGVRLVSQVSIGLEEMATLEDATTSVTGAIAQVGKGWTLTADDIAEAANRIEADTDAAFDDKAIVAASETLIRYGKVSEANLVPAMEVMTDLAARTGDVESAATLLAKSLADPAKAAGKLSRQGIILTRTQQKQIKAMVEVGDIAGAQAVLLEELEKTTMGAAAASAGPYRDALNKLADAGEDLRRGFVMGLAPAILEVSELFTDELAKPATIQTLKDVGKAVGGGLQSLIATLKQVNWGAVAGFLGKMAGFAKQLVEWFGKMPDWAQALLVGGFVATRLPVVGDLVSELGKGLIKGVLGMTAGVVHLSAGTVVGGPGGIPGGGGGGGLIGLIGKAALPVAILSIGAGAAIALTNALDPGFQGRLNSGDRPLANRDPRRFNRNGQVIANWEGDLKKAGDAAEALGVRFGRIATTKETGRSQGSRENAAALARMRDSLGKIQTTSTQQRTELNNVHNSIVTQTDAQKAAAVAQAATTVLQGSLQAARDALQRSSTANAATKTAAATRSSATTVSASMSAAATRIVSAVNALDLSVNVTTVNRTSTINNRYGPSGGSSTTERAGGNTG